MQTKKEYDNRFVIRCRAVIIYQDRLLAVSHTPEKIFYTLPGGHLEWGEDIKECMRRELIEELGIEPKIGRLLYINNCIDGSDRQSFEFFFEIINSEDYADLKKLTGTHKYELSDICWMSKDDKFKFLPKQIFENLKNGTLLSDEVRFIR